MYKIRNEKTLPKFSNISINGMGKYVRRPDAAIAKNGRDAYDIERT